MTTTLRVKNFAQIAEARLVLGDLTVLVGPQGTGKSLLLQWLKFAVDYRVVLQMLNDAGEATDDPGELVDLLFGQGMRAAWRRGSRVWLGKKQYSPVVMSQSLPKRGKSAVAFIPSHRALLLSDGWASPFHLLPSEVPFVARYFSHRLFQSIATERFVFPAPRLIEEYQCLIDEAVFHGARVQLMQRGQRRRLALSIGKSNLPIMSWTSGQREFTPLLLGLLGLFHPQVKKSPYVKWVVIEEPEMGLHPKAIAATFVLVLDLLWRGYKVAISTHSPVYLEAIWAIQHLAKARNGARRLARALGVEWTAHTKRVLAAALTKDYRVHALEFDDESRVRSRDISKLDPGADEPVEAEWGGAYRV